MRTALRSYQVGEWCLAKMVRGRGRVPRRDDARHRLRSAYRGGCRGSGVLDGENEDQVARLFEAVDDQHPSPGSEDEAHRVPASVESPADVGELLEDSQGALDASLGIRRKAVGDDQTVEILHRDHAQPDFGQRTYNSSIGIVSPDRASSRPS